MAAAVPVRWKARRPGVGGTTDSPNSFANALRILTEARSGPCFLANSELVMRPPGFPSSLVAIGSLRRTTTETVTFPVAGLDGAIAGGACSVSASVMDFFSLPGKAMRACEAKRFVAAMMIPPSRLKVCVRSTGPVAASLLFFFCDSREILAGFHKDLNGSKRIGQARSDPF